MQQTESRCVILKVGGELYLPICLLTKLVSYFIRFIIMPATREWEKGAKRRIRIEIDDYLFTQRIEFCRVILKIGGELCLPICLLSKPVSYFICFILVPATQDWEKEAKRRIRIEMDDPSVVRRRTVYDLNAYPSSRPSVSDIWKFNTTEITTEPPEKTRYSVSMVNISACQRFILFSKLRVIELFCQT